jgi:sortase (surface protein transpeptidase)
LCSTIPKGFSNLITVHRLNRILILSALLTGAALVTACQPLPAELAAPLSATEVAEEIATVEGGAVEEAIATEEAAPTEEATATEEAPEAADSAAISATVPPVRIDIPSLGLEIPVAPMTWESAVVDGQRTTRWVVPDRAAGWAVNSAGAGSAGNSVVAGHQARGSAVFEALSLGEVEVEQEILVLDEIGNTFVYRVVEVSAPIPLIGATAQEAAQAAAYVAPTTDARLTLVTGWPSATTTHRLFVVAELATDPQ